MTLFKSSNQIVAEIHNEIDTAQERLLSEAKSIISNNSNEDKAKRLMKAGFINCDIVDKYKNILVPNKKQAELIEYYKQTYPLQKFITESEMDRICKKYNLTYAPVSSYKKDVPDKNLKDIENLSVLKSCDYADDLMYCEYKFDNSFKFGGDGWMAANCKWRKILPTKVEGNYRGIWELNDYLINEFKCPYKYIVSSLKNITENRQGLFIAAPQTHFDLKGLNKAGEFGFGFKTIIKIEPKDPIVFRYVRGGIQIVTKWGLEGEDEALTNEKMN